MTSILPDMVPPSAQPAASPPLRVPAASANLARAVAWLLLALACAVQYLLTRALPAGTPPFDFVHTYQPLAQQFLAQGVAALWSDDSIRAAPLGYLWPALFGADPATILSAHEWVGVLLCLLAFDTARRMHSVPAGLAAAWLVAISPLLRPLLAVPLTEAPFMLFAAVWWWGLSDMHRSRRFAVAAALGATLSMLVRPVWLYPILLLTLLAAVFWWWRRHPRAGRLAVLHGAALLLPVLVMAKNAVLFDHPVVASGAGAALYYGQHPLTGGMEPPVLGLSYDEGLVTRALHVDHLTPAGDKALSRIGKDLALSRPIAEALAELPGRIGRVLFFSNRGLTPGLPNERALRIAGLCLALAGWWALRRHWLGVLLGAGIVIQALQLSQLLYTPRYSIGTLEYPVLLLAGIGVVAVLRPPGQARRRPTPASRWHAADSAATPFIALLLVASAGIAAGYWVQRFVPMEEARLPAYGDPTRDPTRALPAPSPPQVWSAPHDAFRPDTVVEAVGLPWMQVRIRVPDPKARFGANDLWRLRFSVAPPAGERCRAAGATFVNLPSGAAGADKVFLVRDDGLPHAYVLGAHAMTSPLYPWGDGELRLTFACPVGTRVQVQEAVLHESRLAEIYAPLVARLAKELQ